MPPLEPPAKPAESGDCVLDHPVLRLAFDGRGRECRSELPPHLAGPLPVPVEVPAADLGCHAKYLLHMTADELASQGRSFDHIEAAEAVDHVGQVRQLPADREILHGFRTKDPKIGLEEKHLASGAEVDPVLAPTSKDLEAFLDRPVEAVELLQPPAISRERQGSVHQVEDLFNRVMLWPGLVLQPGENGPVRRHRFRCHFIVSCRGSPPCGADEERFEILSAVESVPVDGMPERLELPRSVPMPESPRGNTE